MPSLGGKDSTSAATDEDNVEPDDSAHIALMGELNEEETASALENNEGYGWTDGHNIDEINSSGSEYLMARFIPQVPYQYQPTLIQFDENEECMDYHFGLIRGYHNEMYDENKQKTNSCCLRCSWPEKDTSRRIARRNRALMLQIFGVIVGLTLVFIGITSLIASFVVSSDGARKYLWNTLRISSSYIHIIAIVGLTVLSIGSALVSLCLLLPVCSGRGVYTRHDGGSSFCTGRGDLYVKNAEKTYNMSANQFLYFDAAVYRKMFGKAITVKTIQPEVE